MDMTELNQVFQRALEAYHDGELEASVEDLRLLLKEGSKEPRHISYCGLLIATVEGKVSDGRILCELAVKEASDNPEVYLNLAKVHSWNGQPQRAVEVLRKGIHKMPQEPSLRREIQRVSPRSIPPVFFLHRSHPVNKYIGRTRARLSRQLARRS